MLLYHRQPGHYAAPPGRIGQEQGRNVRFADHTKVSWDLAERGSTIRVASTMKSFCPSFQANAIPHEN